MRRLPIPKTASQLVKNFRVRELEGLMNHLRLYGPLPTPSEAVASSAERLQQTEPSIVLPNPFLSRKNPKTGKWRGPKYSLRRQADLVKKAQATNNLNIVPPGPKLSALELRMKRLQASLSPSDAAVLANHTSTATEGKNASNDATENESSASKLQRHITALETRIQANQERIAQLEEDLEERQEQHELDELAAFEKDESEGDLGDREQRQNSYARLEGQLLEARRQVVREEKSLEKAQEAEEVLKAEQAMDKLWKNPFWVGEVKKKIVRGQELGIKLYAGKKKMFKGHLWEKTRAKKLRQQTILLQDMKKRIANYKAHYKKREPHPLKPSHLSKPPKLPF